MFSQIIININYISTILNVSHILSIIKFLEQYKLLKVFLSIYIKYLSNTIHLIQM